MQHFPLATRAFTDLNGYLVIRFHCIFCSLISVIWDRLFKYNLIRLWLSDWIKSSVCVVKSFLVNLGHIWSKNRTIMLPAEGWDQYNLFFYQRTKNVLIWQLDKNTKCISCNTHRYYIFILLFISLTVQVKNIRRPFKFFSSWQ